MLTVMCPRLTQLVGSVARTQALLCLFQSLTPTYQR